MTSPRRSLRASTGGVVLALVLTACAPLNGVLGIRDVPAPQPAGAVSASRADEIATAVLRTADQEKPAGKTGDQARAAVFTGMALTAANAEARIAANLPAAARRQLESSDEPPVVLAVSAGSAFPRQIVVRTTLKESKLPVLHLLVSPDVRTPYRIAASATMVPGASVRPFAPLATGSSPLGTAAGLAITPEEILASLPASLNFPTAGDRDPRIAADSWTTALRQAVTAKASSLQAVGTLTQQHSSRGVIGGLRASGDQGAVVFLALDRRDVLVNKTGATLVPTPAFTVLSGKKSVATEAVTQTLEFLVIEIPATGPARVVAASEQLYAAQGR
jgi:hypothetical protein